MGKKAPPRDGLGRALHRRRVRDKLEASALAANSQRVGVRPSPAAPLQSILDATDLEELMENVSRRETHTVDGVPLAPPVVVVMPGRAAPSDPVARAQRASEMDATQLRIPRRPAWDTLTTPAELESREREAFLDWRRSIAEIEESLATEAGFGGTMLTPFEKNIHVWRQIWRVVERSDVVVQIVDARNPMLYYCPDLRRYVVGEMHRQHVLLLNKADLLSSEMISRWETYFEKNNVQALFFSAFAAACGEKSHDSRVMGAEALIQTLNGFERTRPVTRQSQRVTVGFTGYPNVGKSSTINVLLETAAASEAALRNVSTAMERTSLEDGAAADDGDGDHSAVVCRTMRPDSGAVTGPSASATKRVGVSSTPGKTKHFQTLVLSETVMLCDCPGLVFPNFSASKAELLCSGVLSIDQMRGDAVSPVAIIARRIPAAVLEGVYGIRFPRDDNRGLLDAAPDVKPGYVSTHVLLATHARARGFMTDHDRPDLSRSARVLLKHYVSGRLLFAHSPPPANVDDGEAGIGPEIISKKGALVLAREQARATSDAGDMVSSYEDGKDAKEVNSNEGESASAKHDGARTVREVLSVNSSNEPGARIRRGKKHAPQPFTRVERSFYPDPYA